MGFYKIYKGKKSELVKSESMIKVNQYCKENGYSNWKMIGMLSRSETDAYNKTAKEIK